MLSSAVRVLLKTGLVDNAAPIGDPLKIHEIETRQRTKADASYLLTEQHCVDISPLPNLQLGQDTGLSRIQVEESAPMTRLVRPRLC